MTWRPIAEYKHRRGEIVVFRFNPVEGTRYKRNSMPELFDVTSVRGFRECTHFYRLPPLDTALTSISPERGKGE